MGKKGLYIIIPAYNEAENIRDVIEGWYPVVEKYQEDGASRLVIINDGSRDDTSEIVKACARTRPLLISLSKENQGHGPSVLYGYRYAIRQGASYIFQTDSDGQTNPAEFDAFWELKDSYDVILGNRVERGDGKFRAFTEKVVCLLLRIYFDVKVPDANAPFRLMRADVLQKYLDRLPEDYALPNIMLTTFFVCYREKTVFQKISFRARKGGKNSVNVRKIVKIGWQALRDFRMFKKQMIQEGKAVR